MKFRRLIRSTGPHGGPARHSALPFLRRKRAPLQDLALRHNQAAAPPPSNGPGLVKTVHSHYGSLPISSPIRCVALSPLPVKIITVVSAVRLPPASGSLLSAAAPLAEVGST